jgi:hypothetical protein
MLTAVLIWRTQDKSLSGQASFASQTPQEVTAVWKTQSNLQTPLMSEYIKKEIEEANSKLKSQAVDDYCDACNITSAGKGSSEFAFETEETCRAKTKEKRLYYRKEFEIIPDIFKLNRTADEVSADFPKVCATFIMKNAPGVSRAMKGKTPFGKHFSLCAQKDGRPENYEWPLCVTEEYVNTIYYTFSDVFSCFGLSQKSLLPKLMQESGMHVNTLAQDEVDKITGEIIEHKDAGFGQLTSGAQPTERDVAALKNDMEQRAATVPACARIIKYYNDTNEKIKQWREEYYSAEQVAARRLAAREARINQKTKKKKKISQQNSTPLVAEPPDMMDLYYFAQNHKDQKGQRPGIENRCELVEPPENPFLNIFYMAAKERSDKAVIESYFSRDIVVTFEVRPKKPKVSKKRKKGIEQNASNESTEIIKPKLVTKHYSLKEIIEATGLSKQVDTDAAIEKLKEFALIHAYNLGPGGAAQLIRDYFVMKVVQGAEVTADDFDFFKPLHDQKKLKINTFIERKIAKTREGNLTYPEFIYKHYPSRTGDKLYLVRIAAQAKYLNKKFKEGACVPEGYLQLQ